MPFQWRNKYADVDISIFTKTLLDLQSYCAFGSELFYLHSVFSLLQFALNLGFINLCPSLCFFNVLLAHRQSYLNHGLYNFYFPRTSQMPDSILSGHLLSVSHPTLLPMKGFTLPCYSIPWVVKTSPTTSDVVSTASQPKGNIAPKSHVGTAS